MVSAEELDLLEVTDSPVEAVATILECYERRSSELAAEPG
jgi:hypothetical protein